MAQQSERTVTERVGERNYKWNTDTDWDRRSKEARKKTLDEEAMQELPLFLWGHIFLTENMGHLVVPALNSGPRTPSWPWAILGESFSPLQWKRTPLSLALRCSFLWCIVWLYRKLFKRYGSKTGTLLQLPTLVQLASQYAKACCCCFQGYFCMYFLIVQLYLRCILMYKLTIFYQ